MASRRLSRGIKYGLSRRSANRGASSGSQQDALQPHHAGHHHRRRCGHRHGRGGARGAAAGTATNRCHGFEHPVRRLGHGYTGRNPHGLGRHEDPGVRGHARHSKRVPGGQSGRSRQQYQFTGCFWQRQLGHPNQRHRAAILRNQELAISGGDRVHAAKMWRRRRTSPSSARACARTCSAQPIRSDKPSASRVFPFKVVGVLAQKGTSAAMGDDQDDVVLVPITTLQKKITGQDWLRWIMVSATSRQASYAAQEQITSLLRDRTAFVPGRMTISWYATWPTWPTSQTRRGAS